MTETLFFVEHGQGMPLTMLHGYPLDHTIWLKLVPEMKNKCRMILPDLRGHGRSPSPKGKYSMREMAEDVVALLDKLDIENTILAGHSMGGYVALAVARHFPQRVAGLALVASHAYADSQEKKLARLAAISRIEKEGISLTLSAMPGKLSYNSRVVKASWKIISKANPDGAAGVLAGMAERPDSVDLLANLDIPILVIAGIEDQIIPIETSREMVCEIKNAALKEISNAGHLPMLDQPEQTASTLLSFIMSL